MAVASQHFTTERALRPPAAITGADAKAAPRWLALGSLGTSDGGRAGDRRALVSLLNPESRTTDISIMDFRHAKRRRARLAGAGRSEA